MTTTTLTLREALLSLDPYQRAQIESISICAENGIFVARMEQYGLFAAGDVASPASGVSRSHLAKREPIRVVLDWRTPIWDQILEVVHDPWLTQRSELGSLEAAEATYAADPATAAEADHYWQITTHGRARFRERRDWILHRQTPSGDTIASRIVN